MTFNVDDYVAEFEEKGATLVNPVLPEGYYEANMLEFYTRTNKGVAKKGPNMGKEMAITNWGIKLALISNKASEIMDRDGDVFVFAEQDCENIKTPLNLFEGGIPRQNNINFWNLVGKILAQVDLAEEIVEDSGVKTYKISGNIIKDFYKGVGELIEFYKNYENYDELLASSVLAELEFKNLTELICNNRDTNRCYVQIKHFKGFRDGSQKRHAVSKIILVDEFEAIPENLESVIR